MNFAVIALPRSRTAWLAAWLNCQHEPLSKRANLDDLPEGLVDTAATLFFPELWKRWPEAKYLFVFRDPNDIAESLKKIGLSSKNVSFLCGRQWVAYAQVRDQPNVMGVNFAQLDDIDMLEKMWKHLKGDGFNRSLTQSLMGVNIQADVAEVVAGIDHEKVKQLLKEYV